MIKYYCDLCEQEISTGLYSIDILVHIKTPPLHSHRVMLNGESHPVSGRTEKTELCIKCYNKLMYPFWDSFKKLKNDSNISNTNHS